MLLLKFGYYFKEIQINKENNWSLTSRYSCKRFIKIQAIVNLFCFKKEKKLKNFPM